MLHPDEWQKKALCFIDILKSDGMLNEAAMFETIYEERDIWCQMAIRFIDGINLLKNNNSLSSRASNVAQEILAHPVTESLFAYEKAIYGPIRLLAEDAAKCGYKSWQIRVSQVLEEGMSSTEIYMAMIPLLKKLTWWPTPKDIRTRAKAILSQINKSL
jgi:hypothetical protein